jgi:hypothetical protein
VTYDCSQDAIREFHDKIFLPDLLDAVQSSDTLAVEQELSLAEQVGKVFIRHVAFLK